MKSFLLALTIVVLSGLANQGAVANESAATKSNAAANTSTVANTSAIANNDDYKQQLCGKVKQCRLGKLVAADMPDFMQDVVVETINTQCIAIASSYQTQLEAAGLDDEAKSCVHSLEDQSCGQLLATKGEANTQECDDFLKLAESSGIDFSKIQF